MGLEVTSIHLGNVDSSVLQNRRLQNRKSDVRPQRYSYNVAIASTTGNIYQAQSMSATYRIPLLDYRKYPFWVKWEKLMSDGLTKNRTDKDLSDAIKEFGSDGSD